MAELLAELPNCDASDQVLIAIDLREPPSKKKKTGKFSCEGGIDDSRSNYDVWTSNKSEISRESEMLPLKEAWRFVVSGQLPQNALPPSSENEGGFEDSRSNDDGWMPDDSHELGQRALFPKELEPPFSGKSSSQNEGSFDVWSSSGFIWMTNGAGLLSPPRPHSLSPDLTSGTRDAIERRRSRGLGLPSIIARKCPVRRPNADQLLSASSDNSDCLNRSPLSLWLRDNLSESIHLPNVGIIFGNLKPENVLMTDRSFRAQLSYIKKNYMDPFLVKSTPEAEDLFSRLLKKNPELRLEAREVLLHPFSWSSKFKLHFLRQMSEMLFSENSELDQKLLDVLKSNEPPVFNENWNEKLDTVFKDYIRDRPENYNYSSFLELVRCMRNNSVHLPRLPRKIKKKVGWNDEDYYNYFAARFPSALMKLYGAASQFCRKDRWFKEFHEEIFRELFGRGTLGHW